MTDKTEIDQEVEISVLEGYVRELLTVVDELRRRLPADESLTPREKYPKHLYPPECRVPAPIQRGH